MFAAAGLSIGAVLGGIGSTASAEAVSAPDTLITSAPKEGSRINTSAPQVEFRSIGISAGQDWFECRVEPTSSAPAPRRCGWVR